MHSCVQYFPRVRVVHASIEGAGEGREEAVKIKEQAILLLGKVLAKHGFAEGQSSRSVAISEVVSV